VILSIGLPVDLPVGGGPPGAPGAKKEFRLSTNDDSMSIAVSVTVSKKGLRKVAVNQLKEGMVLAHEVKNEAGAVLLQAGRLTETNIARAMRHLSPHTQLEVTDT